MEFENHITINFNFGITVNFLEGLPEDYLFDNRKYTVVFKTGDDIYDSYYLPLGHFFRHYHRYYLPKLECDIIGLKNKEFIKLYNHKFDIKGQNVLFDLHPQNDNEAKVWLNYLEMFEYATGCKVYVNNLLGFTNNFPQHDHEILYYASYKVSWEKDIWQNPFGTDCTPFDLINNQLLRL